MAEDLLFDQQGQLGLITLNRADSLNALTLPMIISLQKKLSLWKEDKSIKAVVIRSVPGKAFCAGGDVRSLYNGRNEESEQMQFFWNEYRLNHFIHNFGKPYISLMNGITMGGGVGISLHGSHPVASEHFVFAMPETSIGFFPDIGASYLLTRCPGFLGIYLGLTGNRLGAQDALRADLVKYIVSADQMNDLVDALIHEPLTENAFSRVDHCIKTVSMPFNPSESSHIDPLIDLCFSGNTVEAIKNKLESFGNTWAMEVYKILAQKSPLSLKITLAQLQKAKDLSLADCLKMDYDLVRHFMRDSDFYEGVRSLLIDKDKNPKWNPERLDLVSDSMVVNYFEHFSPGLDLSLE